MDPTTPEGGLPPTQETSARARDTVRQAAHPNDAAGSHLDNRHYISGLKQSHSFVDATRAFGEPKTG